MHWHNVGIAWRMPFYLLVSIVMSFSVTACKQYDEQHSCPPKNSLLFILATFICQLEKAFLILCDIYELFYFFRLNLTNMHGRSRMGGWLVKQKQQQKVDLQEQANAT